MSTNEVQIDRKITVATRKMEHRIGPLLTDGSELNITISIMRDSAGILSSAFESEFIDDIETLETESDEEDEEELDESDEEDSEYVPTPPPATQ